MPLIELPTEIQIQILSYLGTPFFRESTSRLTVCKKWYLIAESVIRKDVHLGFKGLLYFLNPPPREPLEAGLPQWVKTQTRSLMISVSDSLKTYDKSVEDNETWKRYAPLIQYVREGFEYIQESLHELKNLEELTIRVHTAAKDVTTDPSSIKERVGLPYFAAGLQLPGHLRCLDSLELDLCTIGVDCSDGKGWCEALNELLWSLRRLRLRLSTMCPRVLQINEHMPPKLALEHLIINTDLRIGPRHRITDWTRVCGSLWENNEFYDHADLIDAASLIVPRMRNPKIVRIVWWDTDYYGSDISHEEEIPCEPWSRFSYDCLLEKRMKVPWDGSWSDDGSTDTEDSDWTTSEEYSDPLEESDTEEEDDDDDEIDDSHSSSSDSWEDTGSE